MEAASTIIIEKQIKYKETITVASKNILEEKNG